MAFVIQVAFRFGHSQVQHEFRPWINGKPSGRSGTPEAKLPNNEEHPNWILSNNNYFNPAAFVQIEKGKAWINEVEGLIHQKCAQADLRIENVLTNALCVFVNGELALGFLELSLSFYGRPNISDRFTLHFIRIQIFQIDFPLILYL